MSKESHSFNVSVACCVGVNAAIMLQHFIFLQRFSDDGWVKKSAKAIKETYPYLTEKEIRGAVDLLCREGHVFAKIENALKADRTKSFFVSESGHKLYGTTPFALLSNGVTERANGFAKRANVDVTKGQMLIKEGCSINSSFVEGDTPAPAQTPAVGGVSFYLEEKEKISLDIPPARAENSAAAAGPRWHEVPNSNTPRELETYLTGFYSAHPHELTYICERTQYQSNPTAVPVAIADFCAWAIGEGWGYRSIQRINARLGRWFREQKRFDAQRGTAQVSTTAMPYKNPETTIRFAK